MLDYIIEPGEINSEIIQTLMQLKGQFILYKELLDPKEFLSGSITEEEVKK